MSEARKKALTFLRSQTASAGSRDRPGLELLALALTGRAHTSGGFEKVIKMIDEMIALLGKEQMEDDHKKEYCALQFDDSDDKKKALERSIAGEESSIASAKEAIATLASEIAALEAGIRALDLAVAEATAQRKDENAEYKALIASDGAAQEVLAFAKNRLNQFYNPKLYKPPPKTELSAGDRIYSNMGGELTTAAPGGIAGTGITVLAQVAEHSHKRAAPAPPPGTWGAYATKSEEGTGVIAMIDLLIKDLQKEMTEAETQEKDSQADYEQMMKDSADKRTMDSKSLTAKGSAKADAESALQAHTLARADGAKELMATMKYISSLHAECDWLLQYFDARKQARAGEVDSLNKAKAVLSGADFSLLQTTRSRGFLRGHQPIYEGAVDNDKDFAKSRQDHKDLQIPGYRNAWEDCGGVGASETERMRSIAARIKGFAKPLPFIRHAAQDCGSKVHGTEPGAAQQVNYPGPEIPAAARAGLKRAAETLAKYPAAQN